MEKQYSIEDFANWLWDMNLLKVNTQLPPFENADMIVKFYLKDKNLNNPGNGN
jgi:hypothetical protein